VIFAKRAQRNIKMAIPILCLVPDSDESSKYGHFFFFHYKIPELIEQAGYDPVVLDGNGASFRAFREAMLTHNPPIIFTVGGHGAANLLSMQNKEPLIAIPGVAKELSPTKKIIVEKGNDKVLRKRSVYTISCHVSRRLGRKAVEDGACVFAGYRRSFIWLVSVGEQMKDDVKAGTFFDCGFDYMRCLLRGSTFGAAHEFTVRSFHWAAEATDDPDIRKYLLWDADKLETLGNPQIRLLDYRE